MHRRNVLLVATTGLLLAGCRTDQNYAEDYTRAEIVVLRSCLDRIAQTSPEEFAPRNITGVRDFLLKNGFMPPDSKWFLLDGWRRPYKLFVSIDGPGRTYLIGSAGADGKHGTDDDLTVAVDLPATELTTGASVTPASALPPDNHD